MISRLFRSKPAPKTVVGASIPPGHRVYAIGDVHGRLDLLKPLMARILADDRSRPPADTQIILLGDLVDRGPDSYGVVEMVRQLLHSGLGLRCIAGNHEEVFLACVEEPSAEIARFFYRIGGDATLLSYGLPQDELDALDFEALAQRIPSLVPESHVAFLRSLEDCIIIGDYAFVHAGISPKRPLAEQQTKALRWIRDDFIGHEEPFEKMIVYGHTISESVDFGVSRIGLDTGAYASGKLTAMGLEGSSRWFLDTAPDAA